ncbi:MAG: TolC family protein [Candidatus Kapaibacterium sp.]
MTGCYRNLHKSRFSLPVVLILACLLTSHALLHGQSLADSLMPEVTLPKAITYAIKRQPVIRQAILDEEITAGQIRSKLADWYPQVNFNYLLQHNFLLPTSQIGGNAIKIGTDNTSALQLTLTQNIFNRDVLLASSTKEDVLQQSRQHTISSKIDLAVAVSKAFYDVLTTMQQIKVSEATMSRISQSLKDAYHQYTAGLTDKTDYKRATIILNNARAAKKNNEESLSTKLAQLASLMNYPANAPLNIVYDSLQMENDATLDTMQVPDYKARIEYKQLALQQKLLDANVRYTRWSYLPSLSLNGAYNFNFQSNSFGELYNRNYPTFYTGLTLAFPIFQGWKRTSTIEVAELQRERSDWDMATLKNAVNAAYTQALASYKSNYANYLMLKENVQLATEVYEVIEMQYRAGVKTYLEVINAETDLRTARINYYTALYQVVAGKIDVQKALGQINY